MAEFCIECWNKINKSHGKYKYVLSKDLDVCEGCGELKRVIIAERGYYYRRKFKYILFPIKLIEFAVRILLLPYFVYIRIKNKDD